MQCGRRVNSACWTRATTRGRRRVGRGRPRTICCSSSRVASSASISATSVCADASDASSSA
eukprot:5265766-Prymnesium_polylepis.1